MTADISCLENFSSIKVKKGVITAGGHILLVLGVGCVRFGNIGILYGVLYVPNLTANLISLHHLGPDLRCRILFDDGICFFIDKISGKETGQFEARDGLYQVDLPGISGQQGITSFSAASSTSETLNKLFFKHCQLGHPSMKMLHVMFPDLCKTLNNSSLVCEACQLSKQRRISFPFQGIRSEIPLYRIHSDIWGPSPSKGLRGSCWFIIFIDDCTRLTWVYTMKNKSKSSVIISSFIKLIQNQFGTTPKRFRSDNARDYFNSQVTKFFESVGIVHESSCLYTP